MIIISPKDQAGTTGKPGSKFTGDVYPYMTMPSTDGVTINTVNFTPGARTFWHSHENGQILQVLAGRGRIQTQGEPVRTLHDGDTVWVPPGEQHWHGAASDSFMTHTAISLGETKWADAVSDSDQPTNPNE